MNHTWTKRRGAGLCALAATLIIMAMAFTVPSFAVPEPAPVTLRIEGINGNLYYGEIDISNLTDPTAADVIAKADADSDDLTVTGLEAGYITSVNSDGSGLTQTGWDGWLFRLNMVSPTVGLDACTVSAGDHLVLYYSDEFVSGMQFPTVNTDGIANGVLIFTDTTGENAVPIEGMSVTWGYADTTAEYTTDADGKITIDASQLTAGDHTVSVSRMQDGVPTVLRLAPDYKITIHGSEDTTAAETVASTVSETVADTVADTMVDTTADANASTESTDGDSTAANTAATAETTKDSKDTSSDSSGCKSALGGISLVSTAVILGAATLLSKKKH